MTPEFFEANWPVILIVAIVVLLLAFFWLSANRKASVVDKDTKDVLDEGAAPAARNQALIDAPKAAVNDTGVPVPEVKPKPAPTPEPTPAPEPVAPLIQEDPAPPVLGEAPSEPAGEADIPAVEPEPATTPAPAPSPSSGGADDLTQIKGLGPKLAALLNTLGVTTFAEIASWDEADIDRVDAQLDRFKGRIRRDSWVEQAKLLAAGDEAGFSDKFGQNG